MSVAHIPGNSERLDPDPTEGPTISLVNPPLVALALSIIFLVALFVLVMMTSSA